MSRKVKYSYSFKLKCVKEVFKEFQGVNTIGTKYNIHPRQLHRWVEAYKIAGPNALVPRKNQTYTIYFKQKVLRYIEKECLSLSQACLRFDIPSASTIIKWQRNFQKQGSLGLENKPRGRPKIMKKGNPLKKKKGQSMTREEELILENKMLKAENALLKKLDALIRAQEEQKPKP